MWGSEASKSMKTSGLNYTVHAALLKEQKHLLVV